ncbi:MAG TPA: MBL fold metallo-hydrolase [Vicinamibacterales bacterium]|nr:MBL fold metallo-hydrolase [Vicinamibacterales bacterium]
MPELTFLGAARTVTGSKYLLRHGNASVLFDCGLFQGLKELRLRNWQDLPVSASSINAVVLTHAHLDHVGYVPRLVKQGFSGPVFCTSGTAELSRLVLPDSGRIQEEDARQANRHGYSKHSPAMPLYDEADAHRALGHFHPVGFHRQIEVADGVTVEFMGSGHLLGSAYVVARLSGGTTILFGGDLGRYARPVLPDPEDVSAIGADVRIDAVLVESTYGDRDHPTDDQGDELAGVIRDTAARGGKVVIPSFAIGRVEELLYWIRRLERERRIPVLPVYVDSPMASEALRFYIQRAHELDPDMRTSGTPGAREVSAFATARFQVIASPQQSKELTASRKSGIVISSSGMATGGRVLHHLAAALPDPRNTVLMVGFQAEGTRGRALIEGAPELRIHGVPVPVRARVARLNSMSGHADRGEIVRWLRTLPSAPRRVLLVHGEPRPMDALKTTIERELGWHAETPQHFETVAL